MTTEQATPTASAPRPGDNLVQARDLKMYFPVTAGVMTVTPRSRKARSTRFSARKFGQG